MSKSLPRDNEYLIKSIFGKMAEKKEFAEIIAIISYAGRYNHIQSYYDAADWFFEKNWFDWGNHFNSIAIRLGLRMERLYRSKNVCG
jgi:hypothetical protein